MMMHRLNGRVGELKAQGAEEAARNPESAVTGEDAERVMGEESRKAGIAAFHFDPNASPEEKAAQARSRIPDAFHHKKKTQAVGITTDLDDSPDQYELPSPTKDGAIAAASPSSSTFAGTSPSCDPARYAKTGWAPRFGPGEAMSENEASASLLDHQTALESKLDERFYGDWYQNAGVIVFASLSSWLIAVLGGGIGWVLLVLATCGTYYRTSIRRVRRNFRDDINREAAKARLETDTESLEWINSFLVKFWPIYQPVLADTVVNSVDQVLSTSTPAFLDSMRLKFFTLGSKPPRMDHVKTYPKAEDDIVLMDWKFSFTPNDTMDLTARQLKNKIKPKVVLEIRLGKGIVSKGMGIIVEDFAFSGLIRVRVKLQIPFPHVEKIEFCFLERPEIDYVCKPLGGDTFGFDINFIPGLESFIKEQIHGNLQPIMYAPNVFPIEIAKMLAGTPVDQAIGVLAVTIHGAHGLRNPDRLSSTPDPYTVVSLNGRVPLGRTETISQNTDPRWNETIYVIISSLTDSLTLQVFDYNEYRKDKSLGIATYALDHLEGQSDFENLQLEVMANGKARGQLQADVRFFPVMTGPGNEDGSAGSQPESNTGIARFTVEQAKDLDGTKSLIGSLNPYAILLLNGKEIHQTQRLKRTNNPIWDNGSKEFLITDRKSARLGLVIKDDRDLGQHPILGSYQIKVADMMRLMEKGQEWYNMAGVNTGRAKMLLQWKPVALSGDASISGGYTVPIGVLRLHFVNARDLRNLETMGKSDPYVRVLLSGLEKARTVTFQNNLNPDWDEIVYVPIRSVREKLVLEVMDSENIGKDRSLGSIDVALDDYIHNDGNDEYQACIRKEVQSQGLRMHSKGIPKGSLSFTASFYPLLNMVDPEEEAEAQKDQEAMLHSTSTNQRKSMSEIARPSLDSVAPEASLQVPNDKVKQAGKIDTALGQDMTRDKKEEKTSASPIQTVSKARLSPSELLKHESGLLIFKLIKGSLAHTNVRIEIVMDDMAFPSYSSAKTKSRVVDFGETGDAVVRELDVSKVTIRLMEKQDKKGEVKEESIVAKLQGQTIDVLQRCLYKPAELVLRGSDGEVNKITVSCKYIPIQMVLDPSESINNMGTLRVDVLDAADLPAADRNGFSDPYCKFHLNGKDIHKTKIQKKTLHPSWNEFFECPISSRTAADLSVSVLDWDFGDKADLLGEAAINLNILEPFRPQEITLALDGKSGVLRLKMLFKPDYVTRARQGSSTFSGTFETPGKIVGAPVKGVGLVGKGVGGGVVRGASFLRHGLKSKKDARTESHDFIEPPDTERVQDTRDNKPINATDRASRIDPASTPMIISPKREPSPVPPTAIDNTQSPSSQRRASSIGNASNYSTMDGAHSNTALVKGSAQFLIQSASEYHDASKIQVQVKQMMGSKGFREVHKTKGIKATDGSATFSSEMFQVACSPDTQFQIRVKDDRLLGDRDLGESLFFISDTGLGQEKTIRVGAGSVSLTTTFMHDETTTSLEAGSIAGSDARSFSDSPRNRRSLLSRRDRRVSGHSTHHTP